MKSITRREWLAASLTAARSFTATSSPPLNVLLFAVDDLRPNLGCFRDRFAITPNIDGLAARGMVFEHAYCQQALCGPSRASLLTGLRPDTTRVYDLDTSFRRAVPDAITLPQLFRNNGYHTESIGKIFHDNLVHQDSRSWSVPERFNLHGNKADEYALDSSRDPANPNRRTFATEAVNGPDDCYVDGRVAADALRTLERIKDRPFFLGVGLRKPHLPFTAPQKFWNRYRRDKVPLAKNLSVPIQAPAYAVPAYSELRSFDDVPDNGPLPEPLMRRVLHGYYAAVSYADAQIGKVLKKLESLALAKSTIVVLFGDHGWHLGEASHWGKITNFEVCVRAPLIVAAPGMKGGRHSRALVEFVDIYPTLAELCGLTAPSDLEGLSMKPLLVNPNLPWKKAAFSQFRRAPERGNGPAMGHTLTTGRYRYTEWRPVDKPVEAELYDHQSDPNETRNVVGEPDRQTVVRHMANMLSAGWKSALPERPH